MAHKFESHELIILFTQKTDDLDCTCRCCTPFYYSSTYDLTHFRTENNIIIVFQSVLTGRVVGSMIFTLVPMTPCLNLKCLTAIINKTSLPWACWWISWPSLFSQFSWDKNFNTPDFMKNLKTLLLTVSPPNNLYLNDLPLSSGWKTEGIELKLSFHDSKSLLNKSCQFL